MSSDLDLATLEHWFGWMRNSESWRREREIVYGMWAEIERLRQLRDTMLKGEVAIRQRDADEINRLRGELDALQTHFDIKAKLGAEKDAEIERLRSLLQEALNGPGWQDEYWRAAAEDAVGEQDD